MTVPGPGSYNKSQRLDSRGGSMGNEERLAQSKSSSILVPGPGSYKQRGTLSSLGGSVGDAKRFVYSPNGVPGPGQYKITSGFGKLK